jgi:hypothetical protein
MKRIITLTLSIIMLFSLTACQSTTEGGGLSDNLDGTAELTKEETQEPPLSEFEPEFTWIVEPTMEYERVFYCPAHDVFSNQDGYILDENTALITGDYHDAHGYGITTWIYDPDLDLFGHEYMGPALLYPMAEFEEKFPELADRIYVVHQVDSTMGAADFGGLLREAFSGVAVAVGGEVVTDFIYSHDHHRIGRSVENVIEVIDNSGKYGLINRSGDIAVPFEFEMIHLICNDTAFAKIDEKWGIIGFGDYVSPETEDPIETKTTETTQTPETTAETTPKQSLPPDFRGNTTSNINNSGIVAYSDGWIYYTNQSRNNYLNRRLFKMREDGTEITQLSDDWSFYLNVADGWVYYSDWCEDGYLQGNKLHKIRIDGTERTQLNNEHSDHVTLIGDWIYYIVPYHKQADDTNEDYGLYKIRTDGTQRTKIVDTDVRGFGIDGDWLYYVESDGGDRFPQFTGGIYRVKIDGSNNTRILDVPSTGRIVVEDGWIYYVTGFNAVLTLQRVPITGGTAQTLHSDDYFRYNVHNGRIYYRTNGSGLYAMNTDGTGKTRLTERNPMNINVHGDWVYFWGDTADSLHVNTFWRIRLDGSELTKLS